MHVSHLTTETGDLIRKSKYLPIYPLFLSTLKSFGLACFAGSETCIYGCKKKINTRIDTHDVVKDTFTTTCHSCTDGISVTRRKLIYSDIFVHVYKLENGLSNSRERIINPGEHITNP